MTGNEIPEVVINRLPVYVRALALLALEGRRVVSSRELGGELGVTPAQIRKDLSYFGRFGKQGRGYNVGHLLDTLRSILGLDREWKMALVGAGRLGQAILGYGGFGPQGFHIVKAFDSAPGLIGRREGALIVEDVAHLGASLREEPVDIGIVAVPGEIAQEVIDVLVESGVHAVLNYAPIAVRVPAGVQLRQIDPVLSLQSMTYFLAQDGSSAAPAG
ncbi:MAG: redox-sensing transcriptional repressor Rex [Chloroflexi bacterium]|nr:redox-sensing transcriptional repressor Rex [Chloroflexota bacterium]